MIFNFIIRIVLTAVLSHWLLAIKKSGHGKSGKRVHDYNLEGRVIHFLCSTFDLLEFFPLVFGQFTFYFASCIQYHWGKFYYRVSSLPQKIIDSLETCHSSSFVSQITNPTWLAEALPNSEILQDPDSFFFKALAGFSSGYVYTLFFSILPQVFKLLAMSEGTSSSKVDAEEKALRFYWYFMLLTAFTGSFLLQLLLASILEGMVGVYMLWISYFHCCS